VAEVYKKLDEIDICCMKDILMHSTEINEWLTRGNMRPFHKETIKIMHTRSLEIVLASVEQEAYAKAKKELEQEKEIACLNVEAAKAFRKNIWLADLAASTHFVNDDTVLTNVRMIQSSVKIGNGKILNATQIGDLPVRCLSKDNEEQTFVLHNVKYVPKLIVSLLSIPVALNNGFQIGNEGINIHL
jgi:hypothetical protein